MTSSPPSNVVGSLLQSSAIYFLSSVFTNGATFLNSIAVSWYLGKVGLGEFSLCLTAVLIALLLSDMGLNTIILRDYSGRNEPASPSLRFLLGIRTLAASAVTVVITAVGVSVFQESAPLVVAASLLILPPFHFRSG